MLGDRVMVRPDPVEEVTAGGIILPDTSKPTAVIGTVIALGEGMSDGEGNVKPPQVQVGDRVMFARYAGAGLSWKGEHFMVMAERDIYLRWREDSE